MIPAGPLRAAGALLATLVAVQGAVAQGGSVPRAAPPAAAPAVPAPDAVARARAIAADLIRERTTARGNTTPAVQRLAARFRAAGFPAADVMMLGAGARNRNLVVRLRGRDSARAPVLFLAHLDVVDADRTAWRTDPWTLTERGGWLFGRGLIDDKGPAAALAAAFLELRRRGIVPARDLVLALTAGEESGVDNGVQWLLAERPELVRAEYVINADATSGDLQDGRRVAFAVQAAEKQYLDLTLTSRGPGGHSSTPDPPSPLDRVANAVARLWRHEFPLDVNPVVRAYRERRAAIVGGDAGAAMAALARNPQDAVAARTLARQPGANALLRTTCAATMLAAGTAPNAIPSSAQATVNCRVVPGRSADSVVATIRDVIADPAVEVAVVTPAVPSPPSVLPPELERIVTEVVTGLWGPVPVIPYMEAGATDGLFLRNAGIPVFGMIGVFLPEAAMASLHGNDEGMPVAAFAEMVRFSVRLVERIAADPR